MTLGSPASKPASLRTSTRDTVMISHANPEDNEFTLWLALQLTREGYKVWSDVTDFVGGEQFWSDIEHVIRNRAAKFVYVLTRTSNESNRGFRKELHLADSEARRIVKDHPRFVLPIAIDDLPASDYNVYVQQLNCVRSRDWSSGLRELLKRLRRDRVPRFSEFNPNTVSSWWRQFRSARAGITRKPDTYLSNWFPIEALPDKVFWHTLENTTGESPALDFDLSFQFVQRGEVVFHICNRRRAAR
jgi:TIR domain-containing protein